MEKQLTNEEIVKIFALYLGCELETNLSDGFMQNYGPISMDKEVTAQTIGTIAKFYKDKIKNEREGFNDSDHLYCKLILTPLSKISDEHRSLIAKMYGGKWCKIDEDGFLQVIDENNMVIKYFILTRQELPANLFQQLVLWGYEAPIWFGVGHWANGKTAIELRLAIEK